MRIERNETEMLKWLQPGLVHKKTLLCGQKPEIGNSGPKTILRVNLAA